MFIIKKVVVFLIANFRSLCILHIRILYFIILYYLLYYIIKKHIYFRDIFKLIINNSHNNFFIFI